MKTIANVPAAGAGERLKADRKKQFIELGGMPILARTLMALSNAPQIDKIILVAPLPEINYCKREVVDKYKIVKVSDIVEGGKTRQESVSNGLRHVADDTDLVLVHDGVRPFVTEKMIGDVINAAEESGAAITAIGATDTVKTVGSGFVQDTLERDRIIFVQTPQCFSYNILKEAIEKAVGDGFVGTDEASLVERLDTKVAIVEGLKTNIKITSPDDLELAEAILALNSRQK
jgi:2-C-methyl-D-erythritol 4-phosphate cytidylyltransferase